MALFNIPVKKSSPRAFLLQVDLDGANFNLRFRYNVRDGKWRMTIEFENAVLVLALVLVESEDLLARMGHVEKLPAGTLLVRDLDLLGRDPDGTTFGDRLVLLYQEAS